MSNPVFQEYDLPKWLQQCNWEFWHWRKSLNTTVAEIGLRNAKVWKCLQAMPKLEVITEVFCHGKASPACPNTSEIVNGQFQIQCRTSSLQKFRMNWHEKGKQTDFWLHVYVQLLAITGWALPEYWKRMMWNTYCSAWLCQAWLQLDECFKEHRSNVPPAEPGFDIRDHRGDSEVSA